jgi:hypothetical protein
MSTPTVIARAITQTEDLIERQRAVISERTAHAKPVESLSPVLTQIEENLRMLTKMQAFLQARARHMPRRATDRDAQIR